MSVFMIKIIVAVLFCPMRLSMMVQAVWCTEFGDDNAADSHSVMWS